MDILFNYQKTLYVYKNKFYTKQTQQNMKHFFLNLLAIGVFFISCKSDDDKTEDPTDTNSMDYAAQIMSPNSDNKRMDDEIHIHAVLESTTLQTVHHVKVSIYNKTDTSTVVYTKPDEAHVHEKEGKFELHDDVTLSTENGFSSDSDWIIEAKVWGHDAGDSEVTITKEFHID